MGTMVSQITSLTSVYSTVYSGTAQRKHQSSASLAFVCGIHRDRWIPRINGQWRGKCFHLMTSSGCTNILQWSHIGVMVSQITGISNICSSHRLTTREPSKLHITDPLRSVKLPHELPKYQQSRRHFDDMTSSLVDYGKHYRDNISHKTPITDCFSTKICLGVMKYIPLNKHIVLVWHNFEQVIWCTGLLSLDAPFCNRTVHTREYIGYKTMHCGIFV